ncbi:MAG: transcription-repair coupling factor [Syntrophomonas sp.]|nr:transcription-repair coupling factor [Syntrophomonas sp.]
MNIELLDSLKHCLDSKKDLMLSGLAGTARTFLLHELYNSTAGKLLCIVPGEEQAYDLADELNNLLGNDKVALFLERDFVFMKKNVSQTEMQRISTLQELLFHPRRHKVIITTPGGLLYRIISPAQMKKSIITLEVGQENPVYELLKKLLEAGYERADTVTRPGQLAVRGGLVDVFPTGDHEPCRIDFFGDVLESIRRFDIDTQRSGNKEERILISPADELVGEDLDSTVLDYLPVRSTVFFDEARSFYQHLNKQSRRYREFIKEARRENSDREELSLLERDKLVADLVNHTVVYHSFFPSDIPQANVAVYEHISQKEMEPFYNRYDSFFTRLAEWLKQKYTVRLAIKQEVLKEELSRELSDRHLAGVEFISARYRRGFESQTLKLVIVTEQDFWGNKNNWASRSRKRVEQRILAEDLKRGDYVVHELYGIGIYRGVTQVETDGVTREYILLQYSGTDKLYVPVDKLDLLHKYSSSEAKEPRLNKLGGTEWERTRQKVTQSIQEMAQELLALYATRATVEGHAFSPDTPWQTQFEDDFPYQETPDQLKAIIDVKKDMEKPKPMDRLVCGDVGYGKTEVALRAAFKAVMDGKQVAILVPTTVLAEQHGITFKKRFQNFPANVEVLSRFKSASQQKKILAEMGKGAIDVVIATHRLLSKDIKFQNLGLLVVDEEHRFGVAQKEKIKALKAQVDVLSLSATPIPRSLHMGLTGLRDLSVIETPPPERYPITSYVMEYNEEIVREAVLAEVNRGGQVFLVHNRIQDILRVKEELHKLLPDIKIAVGHGRMREDELARTLLDFMQGEYDLLLCTTIIESGLDMPNVNTIIIDMADHMGLAQLYQLRGRVGRSNRIAYAYLTYRPDKVITEASQKRLNAIREFNELGAGIKIALRDLEIRGAGNILGAEQHGYIHAVGFDMYCRLLERETAQFKGTTIKEPLKPQLDIDVDYYIPDSYIPDPGTKMRIYRRLLLADDPVEIESIRDEIKDRFGKMPVPVENFLQVAYLRLKARDKHIKGLRHKGKEVVIYLSHPLPGNFEAPGGLKYKKLSPNSLAIRLDNISALQGLKYVMDMI